MTPGLEGRRQCCHVLAFQENGAVRLLEIADHVRPGGGSWAARTAWSILEFRGLPLYRQLLDESDPRPFTPESLWQWALFRRRAQ
jgi:hypothetical protein